MGSCESKSLSVLHQFDPHRPLKPLFSVGFQQRVLTNDSGPNSALPCKRVILTDSRGTSVSISENIISFSVCVKLRHKWTKESHTHSS